MVIEGTHSFRSEVNQKIILEVNCCVPECEFVRDEGERRSGVTAKRGNVGVCETDRGMRRR